MSLDVHARRLPHLVRDIDHVFLILVNVLAHTMRDSLVLSDLDLIRVANLADVTHDLALHGLV